MSGAITVLGDEICAAMLKAYFAGLVNRLFKILPLWESKESTLCIYLRSLQNELLGCQGFIPVFKADADFVTLLAILQFFVEHPDTEVSDIRREVFRAIRICKRLEKSYA